jgi:UDP-glucose 4-epimerase
VARVIVTGGAGFIGSNLTDELAKTDEVLVIDDLSTGTAANIGEAVRRDNVKFSQVSILDQEAISGLFRGADFVFHQAAMPSVSRSVENPVLVNEVNIRGTLNVLMAARDHKVKKVMFASSSSVYGDTEVLPKEESMLPRPQSPYAVTKITGEYYCQAFQKVYGLATVCLRYFNVYGPRQNPHSQYSAAIPRFITQVMQGKPPIIYGDGEQTRDFTYVKDVVRANILAARSDATGVFNIGTGARVSINDLARSISRLIGKDVSPSHQSPRAGDVRDSLASIDRARAFDYKPQYTLDAGLEETIRSLSG